MQVLKLWQVDILMSCLKEILILLLKIRESIIINLLYYV